MQTKHWLYQYRESNEPWALCCVESYPRGNRAAKKLAFYVYSELIPNDSHCLRVASKRYESADEAADYLADMIAAFDATVEAHAPKDHDRILKFVCPILAKE